MGFFKAYDMRGTFGVDFDLDLVFRIGRALPAVVRGRRWLVGRDCRLSSDAIHDALVRGLLESGVEVTDLGRTTTSMVYYFTGEDAFDGSVMITASHNPPTDNGLKVSKKGALPVSYASGLKEVEALVEKGVDVLPRGEGRLITDGATYRVRYLDYFRRALAAPQTSLADLRFAVDCSNGMSSLFVHELFPQAVILNDTPDGHFPAHSPNPLKAESRVELARVVRERKLDCGVIFDGDADRAMFVDENGDFVQSDYLIPIVAESLPTGKILHDIRTSRGAIETIRERGSEPVMVPVGPALAKPLMHETGAPCGGELAGHYYFAEFHGCDSGLLAAIRILQRIAAAKARGQTFSQLMAPIMTRYANSGELNYKVEDKDAAIARALSVAKGFAPETGRSEIDGIRLEFADGWINIRKSNTEPYLRLLVEHRDSRLLKSWIAALEDAIKEAQ